VNRKEKQVERYLKASKHLRTREEEQELKRRSNQRRAARHEEKRIRKRDWVAEQDEVFETERMARSRGVPGSGGKDVPLVNMDESQSDAVVAEALVVGVAPGRVRVCMDGAEATAILAEALARSQKSSVAVGDVALVERRGDEALRVRAIAARRSVLSRPDPAQPARERVIAANVDCAAVVIAVRRPSFRPRLFDRYLVALQRGGIEPVFCANKVDLLDDDAERTEIERALEPYRALGHLALLSSAETAEGLDDLRDALAGRTAVFVGQSGVGKSSLINALYPELGLDVGDVRRGDGKGRHTTTTSSLYDLPASAGSVRLIDTPGVRGFGLFDLDPAHLPAYFPEFERFLATCRFGDCTHRQEPSCGVRDAVEAGAVPRARYDTYLRLRASLE